MPRLPEHFTPLTPEERREETREEYAAGFDAPPPDPHEPDHEAMVRAAGVSAYYPC